MIDLEELERHGADKNDLFKLIAEVRALRAELGACEEHGVNTESMRLLADALGLREGKHTASSVANLACKEVRVLREERERLREAVQRTVKEPEDIRIHYLKTWPGYFCALWDGRKTFEWRTNDRDFQVGDLLVLQEYDTTMKVFSDREVLAFVTFILAGEEFGVPEDKCVLGFGHTTRRIVVRRAAEPPSGGTK